MNPGIAYALASFVLWGLFPLYFRQVQAVPAFEIVLHRTAWSMLFLAIVLTVLRRWEALAALRRSPRQVAAAAGSAVLLAGNWFVYVWAVQAERVVDASLGYYINPLVNVALGALVLRERLRRLQWAAVAVAALGVVVLTKQAGQLPWIALTLALSFGLYGLVRKTSALGALEGLALETLLLAPLALGALAWLQARGQGALTAGDPGMLAWLAFSGPLTAVPLLLFAAGARRIPLATLGLLQYISPTLQFALGVTMFGEPFGAARLAGFSLIWAALALYSAEGWLSGRARQAVAST